MENRGWPTGSEGVANLKTRIASPFGGGHYTFEYQGKAAKDLQDALDAFSKIANIVAVGGAAVVSFVGLVTGVVRAGRRKRGIELVGILLNGGLFVLCVWMFVAEKVPAGYGP